MKIDGESKADTVVELFGRTGSEQSDHSLPEMMRLRLDGPLVLTTESRYRIIFIIVMFYAVNIVSDGRPTSCPRVLEAINENGIAARIYFDFI